jgi:hypothetical protein
VEAIRAIGKSLDKEFVYRCLGHQDIGDPGDKLFMHFGITKPEPRQGGRCHRGASCQQTGESGFEELGISWESVFHHLKSRSPDKG